jgi:hypothetical protein
MSEFVNASDRATSPRERLEVEFLATRVSFTWLGVRRALDREQTAQAAESFGAEGQFLSAAKKLLDTKHPAYKAVSKVKSQAGGFWKGMSLPFPEPGLRLIRQEDLDGFESRMAGFRQALNTNVEALDQVFWELKDNARQKSGRLYNSSDLPDSVLGAFSIDWSLENVAPPDYLLTLRPDLYEREAARIRGQFEQAVVLAEQGFIAEFRKLVAHLTEMLTDSPDGKPRQFKSASVDNLKEFFEQFKRLSVSDNADLAELVGKAQNLVNGVSAEALTNYDVLRQFVGGEMGKVQQSLDSMIVDRPRRNIVRKAR